MRTLLAFAILLIVPSILSAQSFPKEQYNSGKVTWFGIDYTKIQMVGDDGFNDPENIVSTYFDAWNNFVLSEPNKYDVRKYLFKQDIIIDLDFVKEHNAVVDPNKIVVSKTKPIEPADLKVLIEAYDFKNASGTGVMFVAEYYDKNAETASYLYLVFDVQSKSILFSRRYYSKPKGFGFRNYWAYTIYNTLQSISKDMKKLRK